MIPDCIIERRNSIMKDIGTVPIYYCLVIPLSESEMRLFSAVSAKYQWQY